MVLMLAPLVCLTTSPLSSPPSPPSHLFPSSPPEHPAHPAHPAYQQVIVVRTGEPLGMAVAKLLPRPKVRVLPLPAITPEDFSFRPRPRHHHGLSPATVALRTHSMFYRGHIILIPIINVGSFHPMPCTGRGPLSRPFFLRSLRSLFTTVKQ